MPPWLIVDDTDDLIKYTGPWFAYEGSQFDDIGYLGKPFGGTLHGTSSNASLTFTFNGTSVFFFGTHGFEGLGSTNIEPSVQCIALVSNIVVDNSDFFAHSGNRQQICSMYSMADGQHTIIVNVIFPKMDGQNTSRSTFWFDYVQYAASPSLLIDNAIVMIYPPDPRMQFGSGWMMESYQITALGNMTNKKESTFAMDFIGNSLSWYGYIDQNVSTVATTASYTIDEESPTTFGINASSLHNSSTPFDFQVLFFQTPIFNNGPHKLTVTYNGDVEQHSTPLTLQSVVIQNGTAGLPPVENFTVASSSTSPGPTIFSPALSKARVHTGPVVGGVIGGLTLIVAVILIIFFLRRRRKVAETSDVYSIDDSLHEVAPPVNPFIMTEDDFVGEKEADPGPSTEIASSTPTVVGIPHQTEKTRIRHAHNPSVVSTELDGDAARSNQLGVVETPSLRSEYTPSSRRSPTPNRTPEMTSLQNSRSVSYGSRIVLRDEDSGVRLSRTSGGEVVLLPPEYTLS